MFINLVQYYQMETRWSIKRLLLKTFTAACHLDHIIVDILLTSVLPLEIVSVKNTRPAKFLCSNIVIFYSLWPGGGYEDALCQSGSLQAASENVDDYIFAGSAYASESSGCVIK